MKYLFIAEKKSVMDAVKETYRRHEREVVAKVGEIDFVELSGHVCRYLEPDEYPQWKGLKWSETDLPMVPEKFLITDIKDKNRYFKKVQDAVSGKHYDGIIVATDADVEGNGIYYLLSERLKLGSYPTLRFFESSLTDNEILNSLYGMTDFYRNPRDIRMTEAYLVRSHADWLIGMNATRALSVKTGELLRVGRIKAPTLKLVYDNSKAIENFVPHSDYLVRAEYAEGFTGTCLDGNDFLKFETEQEAQQFITGIRDPDFAMVTRVDRQMKNTRPPKLYKLSTIQTDASAQFNYGPGKTQEIIQSLYENHKLVSYPRTDGEYISSQKGKTLGTLLSVISRVPALSDTVRGITKADIERVQNDPNVVNDAEVQKSSHDALLPTEKEPDFTQLSQEEANIYEMICRRLAAQFLPNLVEEKTVLYARIGNLDFKSNGTSVVTKGWSELYDRKAKGETIPSNIRKDNTLMVDTIAPHEKKSTPPKRLTTGTLINAMEDIAKYISDKNLKQVMKAAKGIGQPSTRAKIIDELIETGYMEAKTKQELLYITDRGGRYINAILHFTISDPVQTAEWESVFQGVRDGNVTYPDAEKQFRSYVSDFVKEVDLMSAQSIPSANAVSEPCPYCGKTVRAFKWGWACEDSRNGCGFTVSAMNGKVKASDVADLIRNGKTGIIKGIGKSAKTGKPFDAALVLNPKGSDHATAFDFGQNTPPQDSGLNCPYCGKPIKAYRWGWACEDSRNGCGFTVSAMDGKVTENDVADLIANGKTKIIKSIGKSAKTGRAFDAALVLNPKGSDHATAFEFGQSGEARKAQGTQGPGAAQSAGGTQSRGAQSTGLSCPYCGRPVKAYRWGWACEGSPKQCSFSVSSRDGKVEEQDLEDLIGNGRTRVIPGIGKSSRTGRPFDACLVLNEDGGQYATRFEFSQA